MDRHIDHETSHPECPEEHGQREKFFAKSGLAGSLSRKLRKHFQSFRDACGYDDHDRYQCPCQAVCHPT